MPRQTESVTDRQITVYGAHLVFYVTYIRLRKLHCITVHQQRMLTDC